MKRIVTNCDKVLTNEFSVNIGANVINCNKVLTLDLNYFMIPNSTKFTFS